jgi:RES domain-containing protein
LHTLERLVRVLEYAPVAPYTECVYRIVADKWRDVPLSPMGSVRSGGRYNVPNSFPVRYCADSQLTAMMEVEALFMTADGQLRGVPRNPDLVLTIQCALTRVVDPTVDTLYSELGTTLDELKSVTPSRFIVNAVAKRRRPKSSGRPPSVGTYQRSERPASLILQVSVSNIFVDSLLVGERLSILDSSGRIAANVEGVIPIRTY